MKRVVNWSEIIEESLEPYIDLAYRWWKFLVEPHAALDNSYEEYAAEQPYRLLIYQARSPRQSPVKGVLEFPYIEFNDLLPFMRDENEHVPGGYRAMISKYLNIHPTVKVSCSKDDPVKELRLIPRAHLKNVQQGRSIIIFLPAVPTKTLLSPKYVYFKVESNLVPAYIKMNDTENVNFTNVLMSIALKQLSEYVRHSSNVQMRRKFIDLIEEAHYYAKDDTALPTEYKEMLRDIFLKIRNVVNPVASTPVGMYSLETVAKDGSYNFDGGGI